MYNYTFLMPEYVEDYTMYVNRILRRRHYGKRRRKMKRGKSRR